MIPKYLQLKEKLNKAILSEKYPLFSKLPTEVELAEIYGVSRSTVRQTLSALQEDGIIEKKWGSGNIVIAKSDARKKNTLALIVQDKSTSFSSLLIEDVTASLMRQGLTVEVYEHYNSLQAERDILLALQKDLYGGLIIVPASSALPSCNVDLFSNLLKRQIPLVFVDSSPIGLYKAPCVAYNYYDQGYQMARSFINKGQTRLGGIFIRDSIASVTCYSGFIDAIRDSGMALMDSSYLWVNSVDQPGQDSRSPGSINKFLKAAYDKAQVVYCDDSGLNHDLLFPVYTSHLHPAKKIGKEAASLLLSIKKDGKGKSITISMK